MSQSELAAKAGVGKRQIRRYESGQTQPTLPIAKAIASALGITTDELAGEDTHRINLTGDWWPAGRPGKTAPRYSTATRSASSKLKTPKAIIHFAGKQLVPNQSLRQTHLEWHIKEPEETHELLAA